MTDIRVGTRLDLDRMRAAVAELLGEVPAAVGEHDDLLGLGLDSISVIRLAGQWRRAGAEVTYAELMEHRTLAQWWALLAPRVGVPVGPAVGGDPEPEVDESAPFGLAPMQHAYWVGRADEQVLGGVGAQFYCEFDGTGVRPEPLERAVRDLLARHGMLRARFLDDGRQQILPRSPWPGLTVHDLRDAGDAAEERAGRTRELLSQRRMAAENGEVLDVQLTLLPAGRTRVHVAIEMLVCDAQSFQVLLAELAAAYAGLGPPAPLDYSFPRYLAGRERRRAGRRDADRDYWRGRLAELPGPPELPLAVDPARLDARRHVRRCHTVPAEDWKRLAEHARDHSVLLSMALVTALAEVLGRWSGTPRFLLDLPFYDRDEVHPDVAGLVGDFTNVVPVAVDVSGTVPFVHRVRAVQDRFHADLAHAAYTGVDVLRDLARGRPAAGPLAPVVFTTAINLGELFGERLRETLGTPGYTMSTTPQVWLDCQVTERGGGLFVNWDAVEDLFPAGVLDAMFEAYVGVLDRLVGGDWSTAVDGSLPAGQARAAVNATAGPAPGGRLHDGFFARAAEAPDRIALVRDDPDAGPSSYGELAAAALRVAGLLVARGVRPGDAVGVSVPRGPDQVAAILGVLAAGAAYVPVGVDQPAARRDRVFAAAGARDVLTADLVSAAASAPPLPAPVGGDPDGLAYVIYTSGSTGEPKGVEISHRAALNTVADLNSRFGVGPADRAVALSSSDFDLSVYDLFGLLSAGGSVLLVGEADRREAPSWVQLVRRHSVTVWNSVPALLEMALVAGAEVPGWARSLRLVLVSGDWVPVDLAGRVRGQAPDARFVALGGATEASIWSNAYEPGPGVDLGGWRSVPYGYPLRNQVFRVVDGRGRDCPDWVAGELWIGGLGVAAGYRNDPERTAERFVTDGGRRWYRTGDLGRYRPGGVLEFLGRRDAQVKLGGYRVELGEVEAALSTHPAVDRAVAAVGAGRRLVAVVTLDPTRPAPDGEQLRRHCAGLLPAYMVPDAVGPADSVPLTANGKIDRAAVARSLDADPAAGRPGPDPAAAPRGPVETTLAAIWSDLLRTDRVSRTDNFFALGGDSLLATRLVEAVRRELCAPVSLRLLLEVPTLAELAALVQARSAVAGPVEEGVL